MTREEINSKTRDEVIEIAWKKMVNLAKEYTFEGFYEVETIVSDWNSEHEEDDEIFMCDHYNEDDVRDGLCLEDDHVVFEDFI
jgi:hypothetical protein